MNETYHRQRHLDLNILESVAIIGVGGVGSWVALNLALTGVKTVWLIDPDVIEQHNLNRTPFKSSQVGQPKVMALAELIMERRDDTSVLPRQCLVEKLTKFEKDAISQCSVIVDCRDATTPLIKRLSKLVRVIGGYDGFNVTLHFNPNLDSVWGDGPVEYTVTPSWLVPPQLIANLITLYLCSPEFKGDREEKIKTINVNEVIKWLKTGE